MYLISGNATNKGPETFPVYLYKLDGENRLSAVRTLVESKVGLYSVNNVPGGLYAVAYPSVAPTNVTVVYPEAPGLLVNIPFNPDPNKRITRDDGTCILQAKGGELLEDFPLLTGETNPPQDTLIQVSLNRVVAGDRVSVDRVSGGGAPPDAAVLTSGSEGGPAYNFNLTAAANAGRVVLSLGKNTLTLAKESSAVAAKLDGSAVAVLAADANFLVLVKMVDMGDLERSSSRTLEVLDKKANKWSEFRQEGNLSRARLTGDWLASIVQDLRPEGQQEPDAGAVEREQGESKEIRSQYEAYQGSISDIPGVLTLDNLHDGRHLVIKTGREDSEVLMVLSDLVFYRVNDRIFTRSIQGQQLGAAKLILQDQRLERVHWAFPSAEPMASR